MKIKLLKLSFFLFFLMTIQAQNKKINKISTEDLKEIRHIKDSTASAAILFQKGYVSFEYNRDIGFLMVTNVQTRIKIYKKDGYDWANKTVAYRVSGNTKEDVTFKNAYTYNLVNNKIEKTKLTKDGEFNEVVNKFWGQQKIVMPNVKVGSIIEYEYTIRSPFIGEMNQWDFQRTIPVNYSELKTNVPEYYVYKSFFKGTLTPNVTVLKGGGTFIYEEKKRPDDMFYKQTNYVQQKIDFIETSTTYWLEDVPALKAEVFVYNMDNYNSSVNNELTMINFPSEPSRLLSTTWEDMIKKIYESDNFGDELKKTGYFEDAVDEAIKGLSTADQKVDVILNLVKKKVSWNKMHGYYCDEGVKSAFKKGSGNTAEINLMLTSMLQYAGLDANPVLISTRSNGIALFPNRTAFNYVIAAVETPAGLQLLDATEKFSIPNVLPIRDLNWFGRLIRKDGSSSMVNLYQKTPSAENVFLIYDLQENGTVLGKIRIQIDRQLALAFRQKNVDKSNDQYLESLENTNNKIEISDYVRENEKDLNLPIVEKFAFKSVKNVEIIGGKLYLTPLLFNAIKENHFKQEKRLFPIEYDFINQSCYNVSIKIPDGYEVEALPKSTNISLLDNQMIFKYLIQNDGQRIQLVVKLDVNQASFLADDYESLKAFFQNIVDKENEKIVFKKI